MNKEVFLYQLRIRLSQLPEDEIVKRLDYYSEIIDDITEDGISEEEAVRSFGDIDEIALGIMQEMPLPTLMKTKMKPKKGWTTAAIVLAVIGSPIWLSLLIAFIAVIASVYICIWAAILCLYAGVLSLCIAGLYLTLKAFFLFDFGFSYFSLTFGAGLALLGLGILAFLGSRIVTVKLLKGTGWFAAQVKNLFIRKEAH